MGNAFRCYTFFLIVTIASSAAVFADGIQPELLSKLRVASVLIKSSTDRSSSSGSGFLIGKDRDGGFVITNEHVVRQSPRSRIEVVLNSGTRTEKVFKAKVVALDRESDLALLRITSTDLPSPLKLADSATITETMDTFILGFPFGDELGENRNNPAITISKASVSSLRKGNADQVSVVQLDGNLNPGNSGGPVVDIKGQVIGVAVATIQNAGIGFAIPVQKVEQFLQGRISGVSVKNGTKPWELNIQVNIIDPHQNIGKLSGVISTQSKPDIKFDFTQQTPLTASSVVTVPKGVREISLVTQVKLASGNIIKKPALRLPIRDGRVDGELTSAATPKSQPRQSLANKKRSVQAIDFGGKVFAFAASPDGAGAFVIREGEKNNELVFWDSADGSVSDRIQVPRAPKDVVVFNQQILVLCPESGVVAVIDPATKKIVNAVPVKPTDVVPIRLCKATNTQKAYVICTPNGNETDRNTAILAIDLESRTTKRIMTADMERAVFMDKYVARQDNFGGSPSGIPNVSMIDQATSGRSKGIASFRHNTVGPIYPAQNGHFIAAQEKNKTTAFTPANDETLWSVDGTLVGAWSDNSRFLLVEGEDLSNPEDIQLVAVDQNGKTLWKHKVPVGEPISMFLTKNVHLHNRHKKLLVGTAHHGSVLLVAPRLSSLAVSQVCVVGDGTDDHLLFSVSSYNAIIRGRFALMIDESEKRWFSFPLPGSSAPGDRSDVEPNEPPETIKPGDELSYQPSLDKPVGKFVLKNGPNGMTVDPVTGLIQWKTDITSLGDWDIEIVDQHDDEETSVLSIEVKVQF